MTYPVVLASASPRRKELLLKILEEFEILPADADESLVEGQTVAETVERLAQIKAEYIFRVRPDSLVIGSDTLVALDQRILGKPSSDKEAEDMLKLLSAKMHQVVTGVTCIWPRGQFSFAEVAQVMFRELSDLEIREYVATGEPLDKAGSYAIQGGASQFATCVQGDMDTVIGLPVSELLSKLKLHNLK